MSSELKRKNSITEWTHKMGDPGKDAKLANPSCNDCYGTGSPGTLVFSKTDKLKLSCRCVVRAEDAESRSEIPWLRRADRKKTKKSSTSNLA